MNWEGVDMSMRKNCEITGNAAARVAAHRERYGRLDTSLPLKTVQTIEQLAEMFGTTKAEVHRSLLRFALTNRDWKQQGLLWGDK